MREGSGKGRFFDDLAGVAGGAFSVLAGLRAEIEAAVQSQTESLIQRLDLVKREELDAALEVARRAREDSEALAQRVAALEERLAGMPAAPQFSTDSGTGGESGGSQGSDGGSGGSDGGNG